MQYIERIVAVIAVLAISVWIWNGVKFVSCDFEPNYKCEIIHGIGVFIPPASLITYWFSDDSVKGE